jgi:hypothetical protein
MNRIKVSFDTWIQLLGMIGVLGGLMFVGLEMRQSQMIAVAGQAQARNQAQLDDGPDTSYDESWRWGTLFRAYDKSSGNTVFEIDLSAGTTGAPMTYMHEGKQYIVVAVSSLATEPEWIALGLSE